MILRSLLRSVVTALLGAVLLVGCTVAGSSSPVSEEDREILASNVNPDLPGTFFRSYSTLAEMLADKGNPQGAADAITVGRITEVAPGSGYIDRAMPSVEGEPGPEVVDFDSPDVNWRTLRVTVTAEESVGEESPQSLVLDWRIFGSSKDGEDWKSISRALRASGTVILMSKELPDSPEFGGLRRVLTDPPYQFAQVDGDGNITFPYIEANGDGPAASDFVGGIDTLRELRDLL
ncbi:MAG: hypothetical protein QM713_04230 [Arachnia sp.]